MSDQQQTAPADVKIGQGRSPAYPYIPLGKAIERIEQVYGARVGRAAYPPEAYYKIWEIGPKSSAARQVMAALNHFGLVEYDGRGNNRKVRLSTLALEIVQDKRPGSVERTGAIRLAALKPPIHKSLSKRFPPPLPDDVFIEHFLVGERGYNESAAKALIREYKGTLFFAGLDKPDNMPESDGEDSGKEQPQVNEGDLIQWTSGGVDQFRTPATVLGFSDDGQWVFTDQGQAAIPLSEVTVMEGKTAKDPPPPPPHVLAALKRAQHGLDDLDEGTSILTSGTLKAGSFEVRVRGEIGSKEIGKIIKLLKAQQQILSDEEEDDDSVGTSVDN